MQVALHEAPIALRAGAVIRLGLCLFVLDIKHIVLS